MCRTSASGQNKTKSRAGTATSSTNATNKIAIHVKTWPIPQAPESPRNICAYGQFRNIKPIRHDPNTSANSMISVSAVCAAIAARARFERTALIVARPFIPSIILTAWQKPVEKNTVKANAIKENDINQSKPGRSARGTQTPRRAMATAAETAAANRRLRGDIG